MTFRLSPSYGLTTGHEANEWFLEMMRKHEEFEVETDRTGEPPLSFWSETVRGVVVGVGPKAPNATGTLGAATMRSVNRLLR